MRTYKDILWELTLGYDLGAKADELEKSHPELSKKIREAHLIVLCDSGLYTSPPGEDRDLTDICNHVTKIQVETKLTHNFYLGKVKNEPKS